MMNLNENDARELMRHAAADLALAQAAVPEETTSFTLSYRGKPVVVLVTREDGIINGLRALQAKAAAIVTADVQDVPP